MIEWRIYCEWRIFLKIILWRKYEYNYNDWWIIDFKLYFLVFLGILNILDNDDFFYMIVFDENLDKIYYG